MLWKCAKSGHTTVTPALVETHLSDLLYKKIRYGSLTLAELCELYNQMLEHDFVELASILSSPESEHSIKYNMSKRVSAWNRDEIIKFDRNDFNYFNDYQSFNRYEMVKFKVLKPLLLGSFTFTKVFVSSLNCIEECTL